jgi:hypothetical protein
VACFSPNAEIIITERNVLPDSYVPLSGNVQGGQNYGDLSFDWKASAGKINSGVSRAGKEIYSLDITGVAPGTTINVNLRVASSLGACSATAQSNITIAQPTPPPTPTTALMPNLVGLDVSSAQRIIDSLGGKRVIATVNLSEPSIKPPNVVIRQSPSAGATLSPTEQVTLYLAQAPVPQVCYQIRIDRIQVDDNGSSGAARWSFDISADGTKVISLPVRNYYKGRSALPQANSSSRQSPAQDNSNRASGAWCMPAGQPIYINVTGVRDGERDPDKEVARGAATVNPSPPPFPVIVRTTTRKRSEGDFTFYFTTSLRDDK